MSDDHTLMRVPAVLVDAVRGLISGSLVAVPREPTRGLLTAMDTAFNAETFRIGSGADPMRRAYEALIAAQEPQR